MAKFEQFRPQLKPGQLIPQGEKVVFELDEPYFDQIVLPVELVDFLLLCTGEHSVVEIIELLYRRKGTIQFKSIYRTLNYLKKRGFLENSHLLDVAENEHGQSTPNEFRFLGLRPIFEFSIGHRIVNEGERPFGFYFLSMLSLILAILSFQFFSKSWVTMPFMAADGSFWRGILYIFITASILLSIKGVFKCLLLLLLTGRAYNFGFALNWFGAYFRVRSDSLFLVNNRLYLILFHLAVSLCYFPVVALAYFLFPNLPMATASYGLAFLLFVMDLDPYQESEINDLFRSFFDDDTVNKMSSYLRSRPLFALVHPFERNRDYNLYFFFTHFSLMWSCLALFIMFEATQYHLADMMTVLKHGPLLERGAVVLLMSFMGTFALSTLYNLSKILYLALILPLSRLAMQSVQMRKSRRLDYYNTKEVLGILEGLPLFNYLNQELLNMIVNRSELKQYNAGTPVIIQGSEGTHLFVLLGGGLEVRKRLSSGKNKVISEIHPSAIFGEIAVIEEGPRTASVIATHDSIVLEIPARMLRQIAGEAQYIRELDSFRNAIMVNQFFTSAPVFRDLPEVIIQMFITKGKIESYNVDDVVFRQGDYGDEFYLLLRGTVGVSVSGRPISRIQQGGFFGEISMIADVPRTATVIAVEPVQVLKVSRDSFWEILAHDINIAMFIETVGEMRVREDIEILRDTKSA